jgi:hypothetical protein
MQAKYADNTILFSRGTVPMSNLVRIVYNGTEAEVLAYARFAEDLPALLQGAHDAVADLLSAETGDDAEEPTVGPVVTKAAAPGFQANGQIIAAVGALIQKAVANAPALIAEIQALAPEISALIALFGKTPVSAA